MSVCSQSEPLLQRFLAYHFDGSVDRYRDECRESVSHQQVGPCPVVQELRRLRISEETIHILNLVPIIHVVWADAPPRPEQIQSVLNNAQTDGIRPGMVAWKLLELWLNARPDASLFRIWNDYVGALGWAIASERFDDLKHLSLRRAEKAAEAMSPGFGLLPMTQHHDFAIRQIAEAFGR